MPAYKRGLPNTRCSRPGCAWGSGAPRAEGLGLEIFGVCEPRPPAELFRWAVRPAPNTNFSRILTMDREKTNVPVRFLFEGQFQHILLLACLVPGAIYLALPALDGSSWLGIPDRIWFYAAIVLAIAHQVVGWFVFRFQLVFSLFSRLFGKFDMLVWGIIFFPLILLRPVLTLGLGYADYGSLEPFRIIQIIAGIVLLIPAIYTGWSIEKYFGVPRALGGDHFRQQYREMPLVKEGAFKYSSNAMYAFAFLLFWAIALLTGSRAALVAALFQHAYIWVHMYCTENPDMKLIYGKSD